MFGGARSPNTLNDLWVYNMQQDRWTWVSGTLGLNQDGTYGIKGVADPANVPGGRMGAASWTDQNENLWLFGGATETFSYLFNDLWKYTIDSMCPVLPSCSQVSAVDFAGSDTVLCEKFCISFLDQSVNFPTSWLWIFPGGDPSSSTDQNPLNICYDLPGVYDVTLITTNASGSDTLTLHNYITVYPTPSTPTITQVGYTLTSSPANSYQWQLNAIDISGATNQSYTVLQSGYYTLIVGDANGCKNSTTTYVLISGVDEVNDRSIFISPNPSNGNFTVEWLNGQMVGNVSIDVVNTLGQKVFSSSESRSIRTTDFMKQIDLSNVASGIYFIEIKTENEFVRKKILIAE